MKWPGSLDSAIWILSVLLILFMSGVVLPLPEADRRPIKVDPPLQAHALPEARWPPPPFVHEDFSRYRPVRDRSIFHVRQNEEDEGLPDLPRVLPPVEDLCVFHLPGVPLDLVPPGRTLETLRRASGPADLRLSPAELQALLDLDRKQSADHEKMDQRVSVLIARLSDKKEIERTIDELARLYRALGNREAELEMCRRGLSLPALRVTALARMARIYRDIGLAEKADEALEHGLKDFPDSQELLRARAERFLDMDRIADAEAVYNKILKLKTAPSAETFQGMAAVQLAKGMPDHAEEFLSRAVGAGDFEGRETQSQWYRWKARVCLSRREWKKSSGYFQQAVTVDPGNAQAWRDLGYLSLVSGRADAGKTLLLQAYARDSRERDTLKGLGICAMLQSDPAAAAEFFRKALRAHPGDFYPYYALGTLSLGEQRPDEADDLLLAGLRRNFDDGPLLLQAAGVSIRTGRLPEAQLLLQRALRFREIAPRARILLAVHALWNGKPAAAKTYLKDIPPEHRDDPAVWNLTGYLEYSHETSAVRERLEKAKECFIRAQRLSKKNTYAASALALIHAALSRTVWSDHFNRPDASEIGNGWMEVEGRPEQIRIRDGRALISAENQETDQPQVSIEREVPAKPFVQMECVLIPQAVRDADIGLRFDVHPESGSLANSLYVVVGRQGKLRVGMARSLDQIDREFSVPGGSVDLRRLHIKIIRVGDAAAARFHLYVNGVMVWEAIPQKTTSSRFRWAVFARAAPGVSFSFYLDNVKLIEESSGEKK